MGFKIINKDEWNRREYFDYYLDEVPCTYSMTVKLDITKLKNSNQKIYPKMIHSITKVVNNHSEFRSAFDVEGRVGIFNEMIPCYTIFNNKTETFSNLWTEYNKDYDIFLKAFNKDMEEFGNTNKMHAKPNIPDNNFPISMIPWTTFEGFNLNLKNGYNYLSPIFTMGKYYKENEKYLLPLAIQVSHAVCDGFHVCRFINELQELLHI